MIEHVWTVLCSRAVIDRDSNNVSLQNVIEQITITGEPRSDAVIEIPLEVVTLWVRANSDRPSRGRTRLTYLSPSGAVLGSSESQVDLSEYKRLRTRHSLRRLPVPEAGRYTFRVELQNEGESEWHQVAAVPLSIIFVPPETEQETQNPQAFAQSD